MQQTKGPVPGSSGIALVNRHQLTARSKESNPGLLFFFTPAALVYLVATYLPFCASFIPLLSSVQQLAIVQVIIDLK